MQQFVLRQIGKPLCERGKGVAESAQIGGSAGILHRSVPQRICTLFRCLLLCSKESTVIGQDGKRLLQFRDFRVIIRGCVLFRCRSEGLFPQFCFGIRECVLCRRRAVRGVVRNKPVLPDSLGIILPLRCFLRGGKCLTVVFGLFCGGKQGICVCGHCTDAECPYCADGISSIGICGLSGKIVCVGGIQFCVQCRGDPGGWFGIAKMRKIF